MDPGREDPVHHPSLLSKRFPFEPALLMDDFPARQNHVKSVLGLDSA
jgi:hypothetical protein